MNKLTVLLSLIACSIHAENLFMRSGLATGNHTGLDWNNAWANCTQVTWGSGSGQVGEGDTLWIAGGSYGSQPLSVGASGSAANRIFIKRARASESACTSAAGWSAAFDATVNMQMSGNNQEWIIGNGNDYVTVDGMVAYGGITIDVDYRTKNYSSSSAAAISLYWGSHNSWVIRNIRIQEPYDDDQFFGSGGNPDRSVVGMQLGAADGNFNTDIIVEYCHMYYETNPFHLGRNDGVTIQHCRIEQTHQKGPGDTCSHANIVYGHMEDTGPHNFKFRWNEVYDNFCEGVFLAVDGDYGPRTSSNWECYGNVCWDNQGKTFQYYLFKTFANGVKHYNNTHVRDDSPIRVTLGQDFNSPSGFAYNNIFYQCGSVPYISSDWNWYSGASANNEANGYAAGATNPFVNEPSNNFQLVSATPAGLSLSDPFWTDITGARRGDDGVFDRGAYEFQSGAAAPNIASNNIIGGIGTNLIYDASATGSPTSWGATNLPQSLSINGVSGRIQGTATVAVTNQVVGLFATNATGFDVQTVLATIYPLAPVISRSATTLTFGPILTNTTQTISITISNITGTLGSTLSGTVHQVTAPWTISGTATYNITSNNTATITFLYSPTSVETNYGTASFTGAGADVTNTLYGYAAPQFSGTNAVMRQGLVVDPMTTNNDAKVYLPTSTGNPSGAVWWFMTLPTAGYLNFAGTFYGTTNTGNDSIFFTFNGVQRVIDLVSNVEGFQVFITRTSAIYGEWVTNFNYTNQFAGQMLVGIHGREPNAFVDNVTWKFTSTGGSDTTPPTIAITNPTTGIIVTNATYFGLAGTASDDSGIITYVIVSNATTSVSMSATGTTPNWTNANAFTLNVGTNIFRAYCVDTNSNSAVSSDVAIKYIPPTSIATFRATNVFIQLP